MYLVIALLHQLYKLTIYKQCSQFAIEIAHILVKTNTITFKFLSLSWLYKHVFQKGFTYLQVE